MDEMQTSGLITMLCSLPGLSLGLAMLMGRWKPASLAAARDPDRARIASGFYCVMVGTMVLLLGAGLLLLPEHVLQLGAYTAGTIVVVSLLGLIPLFQATKT